MTKVINNLMAINLNARIGPYSIKITLRLNNFNAFGSEIKA